MVHGYRGEGKTWFGLSIAYALATGQPLLGWEVNERRVLYVDGELSAPALQKRLKLMGSGTDNLTLLTPDLWQVKRKLMPNLADEDTRNWLDQQIEAGQHDVVILDSLSTLIRGVEENDAGAWEPIQIWILEHRGRARSVIFLHHQGRSRQPRGTSKREDIVESVIGLKKRSDLSGDTDTVFELTFDKSRDFFGAAAQPLLIRLSTESGQVQWTHETVRDHMREQIRKLWKASVKQKDIAKEVGVSQPRVSQIVQELRREENARQERKISV
jgi:putative DNA primase/helicase